jgi:hypothetical protein
MTHSPVQAMVFVLSHRLLPDAGICIEYCLRQGYVMCGVVRDDWDKAIDYLYRREADVLVVADARTLDPDRTPRVEVVAHHHTQPQRPDVPTGRRGGRHRRKPERTRMLKRDAAA